MAELGARMSSSEFTYWMAREGIEPRGDVRDDLRAANIARWMYRMWKTKESRELPLSDFCLSFRSVFDEEHADPTSNRTSDNNRMRMKIILGV